MKVHELKIWSEYFDDIASGRKTFEVRKNDRDFKEGDLLMLMECVDEMHTGRGISKTISYILEGGRFGIQDDYIVMSLI